MQKMRVAFRAFLPLPSPARPALLLAAFIGGCSGPPERGAPPLTLHRDSAGVSIAETADLSGVDTLSWTADLGAALTIGLADGAAPYLFSRIAGAPRLSDGRIVIADRGTDEVRFFDASGRFIEATGGRGDGPLEYRGLSVLERVTGDSLVVVDRDGGRVTILDPHGRPVRRSVNAPLGGDELPAPAWAVFGDGTRLLMPSIGIDPVAPGVIQHHSGFRRVAEDGRTLADFAGAVQSLRMVNTTLAGPGAREGGDPPSRWSVGDRHFVYAPDPRVLEWWIYALDGRLERIIRMGGPAPWTAPPGDVHMGLFTLDGAGRLWVELPSDESGVEAHPLWVVFDEVGEPRHALRLPRASTSSPAQLYPVMEIGEDYVLLATTEGDLIPVVSRIPLRKEGP